MSNICTLCPNACKVDKTVNEGACGTGDKLRIAKYYLHPFEEPCISHQNGSGTVFFCGCSLRCVFCQNYPVSRNQTGKQITIEQLADVFKQLEQMGADNINLVNPTHYVDKIIKAFNIYKPNVPVVYNTHGFESLETLKLIDPYVDIYLPDMKFVSPFLSKRYTGKQNYFEVASKALEFMVNKPLKFAPDGKMISGTIIRHLVLPQGVEDSKRVLDWFAPFKDKAYINIMSQYTPYGEIDAYPELKRKITKREYQSVIDYAISLGIENAFYQDGKSADTSYIPKWDY